MANLKLWEFRTTTLEAGFDVLEGVVVVRRVKPVRKCLPDSPVRAENRYSFHITSPGIYRGKIIPLANHGKHRAVSIDYLAGYTGLIIQSVRDDGLRGMDKEALDRLTH